MEKLQLEADVKADGKAGGKAADWETSNWKTSNWAASKLKLRVYRPTGATGRARLGEFEIVIRNVYWLLWLGSLSGYRTGCVGWLYSWQRKHTNRWQCAGRYSSAWAALWKSLDDLTDLQVKRRDLVTLTRYLLVVSSLRGLLRPVEWPKKFDTLQIKLFPQFGQLFAYSSTELFTETSLENSLWRAWIWKSL